MSKEEVEEPLKEQSERNLGRKRATRGKPPESATALKDPLLVAIGAKIRSVREAKGYAQEEFAYLAGINRSYYGAVERGRYSVTAVNLVRIAVALGVEVGALFPEREELAKISPLPA